jgi:hypothetical protein
MSVDKIPSGDEATPEPVHEVLRPWSCMLPSVTELILPFCLGLKITPKEPRREKAVARSFNLSCLLRRKPDRRSWRFRRRFHQLPDDFKDLFELGIVFLLDTPLGYLHRASTA